MTFVAKHTTVNYFYLTPLFFPEGQSIQIEIYSSALYWVYCRRLVDLESEIVAPKGAIHWIKNY